MGLCCVYRSIATRGGSCGSMSAAKDLLCEEEMGMNYVEFYIFCSKLHKTSNSDNVSFAVVSKL
jgi:hypothetical protein